MLLRLAAAGEMATNRYAADDILAFEELARVAWKKGQARVYLPKHEILKLVTISVILYVASYDGN